MNEPGEGLIGYDDIGVIPKTQALKYVIIRLPILPSRSSQS
jgi:hypothetical protein